MFEKQDENADEDSDLRQRAQSTSHLLSPDSASNRSILSRQDRSLTPSPTPSSASSSILGSSPKATSVTYFKNAPSTHKPHTSSSPEDGFVMTIIRSPSTSSQRMQSIEPATPPVTNEDLPNNGSFLRNKVTAALNHMKYRWAVRMRPTFRTNESPICLLGKMYSGKEETTHDDIPRSHSEQSYTNFLKIFSQRIYFSYRKQFEPIAGSRSGDLLTTDGGWGCMVRCAQMLLAQTFLMHMMNTFNSHYSNIQISDRCPKRNSIDYVKNSNRLHRRMQIYTDVIRLFGDYPHPKCPFGIHKLVELGTSHGIRPGDFFGPVSAAHCLKEALQIAVETNEIPELLRIYISQDAIVYRQDVNNLCNAPLVNREKPSLYPSLDSLNMEHPSSRWLTSVLILVPLRLGLHELDMIYEDHLKEALKLPQTVGIIGGSPRHAVYIVGFQDDSFIALDPHFIQTTVNTFEQTFDTSSYSCSSPKKLPARKMDPSCTLGFFCRDKADFEIFCAQWNHICKMTSEDRRVHSIFRIESGTFEESHVRMITSDYPTMNDVEDVLLRVTKLSPNNKPLPNTTNTNTNNNNNTFNNNNKNLLFNSATNQNPTYRDSWDDAGRSLADNHNPQLHSISDDYVFL